MTAHSISLSYSRLYRSRYLIIFALFVLIFFCHRSKDEISRFEGRPEAGASMDVVTNVPNMADSCANALASQIEILKTEYRALLPGVKYVAIIGFPGHSNKGDSAIWSGQSILLEAIQVAKVYIARGKGDYNATLMREILEEHGGPDKTAIIFHGGGNFGDIWHREQQMREIVVKTFHDYRIRSFPQTYKFYDQNRLAKAQDIYGRHPDLQLAARDSRSFIDLQNDFGGKNKVILVPDAATMLMENRPKGGGNKMSNSDFVFLARTDKEGAQNHWEESKTIEELQHVRNKNGEEVKAKLEIMDWLGHNPPGLKEADWDGQAWLKVNWAYDFLNQGAFILSDRLHVHILSTLWGIDHVVIEDGEYAKVRTYHDTWLLQCEKPGSMAKSVREGVDVAKAWYKRGGSFQ